MIAISSPACLCVPFFKRSKSARRPGDLNSSRIARNGSSLRTGPGSRSIRWNNASRTGRNAGSLPTSRTSCIPILKIKHLCHV